jgi:hypothetical protein
MAFWITYKLSRLNKILIFVSIYLFICLKNKLKHYLWYKSEKDQTKYTIMKVNEATDLFANMIKSLHSAESKLEKELPGLAKKATDKELAKALKPMLK